MARAKSFWTTLPGILTGIAAIITAISGLIALYHTIQKEPKLPDQDSSDFKRTFVVVSLRDEQEIRTSDMPFTIEGNYSSSFKTASDHVWVIFQDSSGKYWFNVGNPEVSFLPDGRWIATNVSPILDTRVIHFVIADANGHARLLQTPRIGPFNELPNGAAIVRSVMISLK